MSIKFTRDQRRTIRRAIFQIDGGFNTLEEVHDELCDKYNGTKATGPKAVANMEATSAVYDVLSQLADAMRATERLVARPIRIKKERKTRRKWLTLPEMKERGLA